MSEFTPTLSHFRAVYGELCADWCRDGSLAEFDRVIAKIKADAWDEGYETGCSSPYGTATPSGKPYDPEPNPYRERGRAMSKLYDRTCTTCGHKINDHDANECWKQTGGEQCGCGWMGVPDE